MSPRALAATLPKVTKPVLQKRGRAYATLIAQWAEMLGPALAAVSLPEKLTTPPPGEPPGGTLTIRVAGAAATDIQHLAPQIVDRINTFLGFHAVARLKLVQGPLPGASPRPTPIRRRLSAEAAHAIGSVVADVTDPALRAALDRLGRSLIGQPAEGPPPPAGRR